MAVIYRQIQEKDNRSLAGMIRNVFREHNAPQQGTVYSDPTTNHLYELFLTPKSVLWIVETEGEALGCCGIFPTPGLPDGCAELVKFYLDKRLRGTGTGKKLMEMSFQSAIELGYTQLYIESLPEFSKAISMYEKSGFVLLDSPLGNSAHPGCNIWMLKKLG